MASLAAVCATFLPLVHTANAGGIVQCFPALLLNSCLRWLHSIYTLFSKYQLISNHLTDSSPGHILIQNVNKMNIRINQPFVSLHHLLWLWCLRCGLHSQSTKQQSQFPALARETEFVSSCAARAPDRSGKPWESTSKEGITTVCHGISTEEGA